jgi:TnpA family transposase
MDAIDQVRITVLYCSSQLLSCSASEVHAMVEGVMRHGTDMSIESNFVDSHGTSFIGFGITRLLGFDSIARFKQINHMKLYPPDKGGAEAYPLLEPTLTRPTRWDHRHTWSQIGIPIRTPTRARRQQRRAWCSRSSFGS